MSNAENIPGKIFASALEAADPAKAVERHCGKIRSVYRNGGFSRLLVTGFGKASVAMARAVEEHLGDIISAGAVITKYGHAARHGLSRIRVYEAGHPVPDENGVGGTAAILDLADAGGGETLAVVLISGGGSALFVSPYPGISLGEKQRTTSLLLKAGAEIHELNTVRKHLSGVKGGRFAKILSPARSISLILSDVVGDSLEVIASGPTSPDSTTFADAYYVLVKYGLAEQVPRPVAELLEKGLKGLIPETPKTGNPVFRECEHLIIGSNRLALDAALHAAEVRGIKADLLSAGITGEAAEAGRKLAAKALAAMRDKKCGSRVCLVSGGETTVTVTGTGKGGRNMELALAFAMEIEGIPGITLLSAGTDGTDGPTDAAGAIVDGMTVARAKSLGLDPAEYLRNNDSYNFFLKFGGLFVTGPTGTNVMDVQIAVLE